MGYYSDVGIALTQKGRQALKEFLKEQGRTARARELRGFLASAEFHRTDSKSKAEVWLWKNIKWYENDDSFPEVALLERLLRELPLEEYLFMRVGEYPDDVEEQGNFWDNPFDMHFVREIAVT